jgi:hypothetical protein
MAISLRNLPLPLRVLFTAFLMVIGIGYLTALVYLFYVDIEPHASKGQGMLEGIAEKYHGKPTRLEMALQGPMKDRVGTEGKVKIMAWLRGGATAQDFELVKPVLDANCAGCHSANSGVKKASGEPLPSFSTYEEISALAEVDTGPSIAGLARVSHVHLFGISLIFLLTGCIFALGETPLLFRTALVALPYVAILADVGSWWLTKLSTVFAGVVLVGGALMGLSLALQILIPLWEMWLASPRPVGLAHPRDPRAATA